MPGAVARPLWYALCCPPRKTIILELISVLFPFLNTHDIVLATWPQWVCTGIVKGVHKQMPTNCRYIPSVRSMTEEEEEEEEGHRCGGDTEV